MMRCLAAALAHHTHRIGGSLSPCCCCLWTGAAAQAVGSLQRRHSTMIATNHERRVGILWDLDNQKPVRDQTERAVRLLRKVAERYGTPTEFSAFGNFITFLGSAAVLPLIEKKEKTLVKLPRPKAKPAAAPPISKKKKKKEGSVVCPGCNVRLKDLARFEKHFTSVHEKALKSKEKQLQKPPRKTTRKGMREMHKTVEKLQQARDLITYLRREQEDAPIDWDIWELEEEEAAAAEAEEEHESSEHGEEAVDDPKMADMKTAKQEDATIKARQLLHGQVRGSSLYVELTSSGVDATSVSTDSQAADMALQSRAGQLMSQVHTLIVISDDSDFIDLVKRARRRGLRTSVVGTLSGRLGTSAHEWLGWPQIQNGVFVPARKVVWRGHTFVDGDYEAPYLFGDEADAGKKVGEVVEADEQEKRTAGRREEEDEDEEEDDGDDDEEEDDEEEENDEDEDDIDGDDEMEDRDDENEEGEEDWDDVDDEDLDMDTFVVKARRELAGMETKDIDWVFEFEDGEYDD